MRRLLLALLAVPWIASAASAATAISVADAQGLVGEGGSVVTTTAALSQVNVADVASSGETTSTLFKSISAAQSSTVTSGGMGPLSPPPAIPEPATWALILAGVGGVGALRRMARREHCLAPPA